MDINEKLHKIYDECRALDQEYNGFISGELICIIIYLHFITNLYCFYKIPLRFYIPSPYILFFDTMSSLFDSIEYPLDSHICIFQANKILSAGVSAYHVVTHSRQVLLQAGFTELALKETWKLEKGGRYKRCFWLSIGTPFSFTSRFICTARFGRYSTGSLKSTRWLTLPAAGRYHPENMAGFW